MKNLIVLLSLLLSGLFFTTYSYCQISSTDLLKKREKKVKLINKQNESSENKAAQIAAVDSFYMPLIREVIKKESSTNPPEKEKNYFGQTSLLLRRQRKFFLKK